jgi:hypothetical protein
MAADVTAHLKSNDRKQFFDVKQGSFATMSEDPCGGGWVFSVPIEAVVTENTRFTINSKVYTGQVMGTKTKDKQGLDWICANK